MLMDRDSDVGGELAEHERLTAELHRLELGMRAMIASATVADRGVLEWLYSIGYVAMRKAVDAARPPAPRMGDLHLIRSSSGLPVTWGT